MNEYIVYRHNLVVSPKDKWYCPSDDSLSNLLNGNIQSHRGFKILSEPKEIYT